MSAIEELFPGTLVAATPRDAGAEDEADLAGAPGTQAGQPERSDAPLPAEEDAD